MVVDDPRWAGFRPKLAKWLCLCENYRYRMSFLVLVITDRVQKALANQLRHEHPSHPSRGDKYGLVHYCKGGGKASASAPTEAEESGWELPDDMPIVEAYFRHVDQHIYSSGDFCRKMLGLDGDPVGAGLLAVSVLALWKGRSPIRLCACAGGVDCASHATSGEFRSGEREPPKQL